MVILAVIFDKIHKPFTISNIKELEIEYKNNINSILSFYTIIRESSHDPDILNFFNLLWLQKDIITICSYDMSWPYSMARLKINKQKTWLFKFIFNWEKSVEFLYDFIKKNKKILSLEWILMLDQKFDFEFGTDKSLISELSEIIYKLNFSNNHKNSWIINDIKRFLYYKCNFIDYIVQNSLDLNSLFKEFLDYSSVDIKNEFVKIDEKERNKNIQKINTKQIQTLDQKWIKINPEKFDKNSRNLVLYFRKSDMNGSEFLMITYILHYYIEWWYSKIFNKLKIVSRTSGKYPKKVHELFNNIEYLDVEWDDFEKSCWIYANTICLTHWTPEWAKYYSNPILCEEIVEDKHYNKKMPLIPKWVKYQELWLTYDNKENYQYDIDQIFTKVMKSIIWLEQIMLD